ncbi:TPR-containing protein DDB_G0280363-like isoform X2 [Panonychus citri]|uniref:TPR-containing protein DDB_G0280363-like isoform X2 n=1 Tax=Panonychus citri TaxID=50023 RepID=UPI00230748C3|nr:TPR-containing protein DDB_G0280363-like isoform X2 [Panonychus citri]
MFGVPGAKGVVSSPPQPWIRFNDSPTPLESPLAHQPPLSHQYNQSSYHQQQTQQQQQQQSQPQSKVSSLSPPLSDNFSPNENINLSNGIQLANFDFNAASIEKDPKILHPVALRVSPDGQLITYDPSVNNSGSNSSSSSSSNGNHFNTTNGSGTSVNSSCSIGGSNSSIINNCGPSSSIFLKSLPSTTCQHHSAQQQQQESSTSLIQSTASQSFQPLSGKKDLLLAPPPPPRPHRRPGHARSSSLDLNCLEKSLPSISGNQGRKLITNCLSNLPSNNALGLTNLPPGVDRKGAFTVYRKTQKDHSSTIRESTSPSTKGSNKWLEILKAKYHPPKPVQMPSIYDFFQNKELVDYIQDLQERCYRLETMNNELIHKMANLMEDQSYFHHSHHSNHHVDYKRLSK